MNDPDSNQITSNGPDAIVTVVSWEKRFLLGLQKDLADTKPRDVLLLRYRERADRTHQQLTQAYSLCEAAGAKCDTLELSYLEPEQTWRELRDKLLGGTFHNRRVLVDIGTMPREAIWTVFLFLQHVGAIIEYAYHEPREYGPWLSRDPEKPRLVFQLSGEPQLGRKTILMVTTGFDPDRTIQLIRTFAPEQIMLGFQVGRQFDNERQNRDRHQSRLRDDLPDMADRIKSFELNAYAPDHGRGAIETNLADSADQGNLIMASLGPKLSAVALYQFQRKYPSSALAYAPSREFNIDYSSGIGQTIRGVL